MLLELCSEQHLPNLISTLKKKTITKASSVISKFFHLLRLESLTHKSKWTTKIWKCFGFEKVWLMLFSGLYVWESIPVVNVDAQVSAFCSVCYYCRTAKKKAFLDTFCLNSSQALGLCYAGHLQGIRGRLLKQSEATFTTVIFQDT